MKERKFDPATHYQSPDIATSYDEYRFSSPLSRWGHRKEVNGFVRALDLIHDASTVLDVPCGTGRMTKVLLARGLDVTGADISSPMIDQAKKKLSTYGDQVQFVEADLTDLNFEDNSFDLITCVRLFGHVPIDVRLSMLREMRRVTKKWVVINYFYITSLSKLKRWVKRVVFKTYEGVIYPTTKYQMRQEIRETGLKEEYLSFGRRYYSEEVYALLSKS